MQQEKRELTMEEMRQTNEDLIRSGGILRDYDNNEILYPLSISLLKVLDIMKDIAEKAKIS